MSVSVIITVFNKTAHVRNVLMSLNSQTVQPDEVVLADDGSAEDIIKGIEDIIPRCQYKLKHVWQEDKGFRVAKSRNNGARHATGDYLVYFDQDIVFTKHYLEQILTHRRERHFYAGYPIWLTEEQTKKVSPAILESCDFSQIATEEQIKTIVKQYWKERLYTFLHTYGLRRIGPSLRSCGCSFYKSDFIYVNGFDETYQQWGYEDDDLGVRLHAAGIKGFNPIKTEYALHCYHPQAPRGTNGRSLNRPGFKAKEKTYNRQNYRCEYGYDNPLGQDTVRVSELN